ncbi:MAG: S-layer homology domain-containing protein [Oscillospiraceae bacterium]|nr:S-layer homology domain-containing protein [Oscillospiraceae bacterium]
MKHTKKLLAVLLVLCMVFALTCTAFADGEKDMAGKIVILHSNDVHGALEGYAKIAGLRDEYVARGAEVLLVDAGDYIQGTPYVSVSKGQTAIQMMNAAGYDYATVGNHEFDFGYENLVSILKDANFKLLCSDVMKDGKSAFDSTAIVEKGGVKIGLFGLETPETYTKVNPALIQGISFPQGDELYANAQAQIDALKAQGADVIICLSHLGVDAESEPNRSVDVFAKTTGIDMMLDGHSHTVMTAGEGGEPIQSTGTKFANVGVVVIDGSTKKIVENKLVAAEDITDSEEVLAEAKKIEAEVDAQYGSTFAKSEVELNGEKAPGNRNMETNLGDLITDSMVWSVIGAGSIAVPDENVVAITNGGGIRAWIHAGDISMKDVNTVLPFGNTIAVVYVKGTELLEALEASTYSTPGAVGGFPQISGMSITINTDNAYDQGEQYPDSTYYGPKSITRVTIDDINGRAYDPDATYAVITNNFCAAGGDTYYAFKAASDQFDTNIPLDEALMQYIKEELNAVIGEEYAEPQGRIFIGSAEEIADRDANALYEAAKDLRDAKDALTEESFKALDDALKEFEDAETAADRIAAAEKIKDALRGLEFVPNDFTDVPEDAWYAPAVDYVEATGLMAGIGDNKFDPQGKMTRGMLVTVLYRMEGEPDVSGIETTFTDVPADKWYADAVAWAFDNGIVKGMDEKTFAPDNPVTREQMAAILMRYYGVNTDVSDEMLPDLKAALAEVFTDADSVSNWATLAVCACVESGLMKGDAAGTFRPTDTMSRAECAQILKNMFDVAIDQLAGPAPETPAQVPEAA